MLLLHPAESSDDRTNNTTETCTEWSVLYNNCQVKSAGTVESTTSDKRPTETSGTRNVVTNTAESDTSKGSADEMAMIVGTVIGAIVFVFLLIVTTLTAIVCLRKRRFRKTSNHLINGPVMLELKSEQT